MKFSDKIKGYEGQNPFSDSQSRNFSDKKTLKEFCPISSFWSLFNDQHEILIGSRGSGKTFLLKMMRYSMLKKIDDERAEDLVNEKKYMSVYVPMHLEYVVPFNNSKLSEDEKIELFQVSFNCFLAQAIICEIESLIDECDDIIERTKKQINFISEVEKVWFGSETNITDFASLTKKIQSIYYNIDWNTANLEKIPIIFKRTICTPLIAIQKIVYEIFEFKEEPTWIVCIDEAEFLNDILQKCINSVFRSDSNRIALKVATLPFAYKTLETLVPGVSVSDGNDFSFRVVDMDYESIDFITVTDSLCKKRLYEGFSNEEYCESLEEFVGVVGKDDLVDYYRLEVGEEKASPEQIEKSIIDSFSDKRKNSSRTYTNKRKEIYDKFAPVFYLREMKKLSETGNNKPGWYAGAKVIRKVSQGNPRLFIQLMCVLFEKARKTELTPKRQHAVIFEFCKDLCEATKALENNGPVAYKNIMKIAMCLSNKVHGDNLVTGGYSFFIKYANEEEFKKNKDWLELAIAYSRIICDEKTKKNGLNEDTKFFLSNAYAVAYWIPMRRDECLQISLNEQVNNSYRVSRKLQKISSDDGWQGQQMTIFEVIKHDEN